MATYKVPAAGVRSIEGVNLGNTSSSTVEGGEIIIDSPHQLECRVENSVLTIRVVRECSAPAAARTINLRGMSIVTDGHMTTIKKPSGVAISLTNRF